MKTKLNKIIFLVLLLMSGEPLREFVGEGNKSNFKIVKVSC